MRRLSVLAILLIVLTTTAAPPPPTMVLTYPNSPTKAELDRLSLQMAWKLQLPCDVIHNGIGSIQLIGDQLYVQTREGTILAIDAETGKVDWTRRVTNPYPVIRRLGYDPDLVLALDVNRLVALEKKTGTQRWTLEFPDVPVAPPMAGELLLYVPFANGRVITYALPETVVKALEQDRKGRKAIAEKVAKIRENVGKVAPLVPTGVNLLNADASGGRSATSTNVSTRAATTSSSNIRGATTSMALHKSASYVTTRATKEEIADAAIEPTFLSSRSPGFRVDNPVLISPLGLLFSGKSNETLTLRRDPENPSFKFATAAPLAMAPSQFGDFGYFACDDGAVYAVDLAKGKPQWHFAAPSPLKEPMIVTDTGVFGAMRQGGVLMIDRAKGSEAWTQPEAQKLVAISKNYVYAYDRIDRLLVLDRATGIVLTQFDMSKFNVPFVNERTDRVILAANDGSLICLRDQGQTEPLRHEVPIAVPQVDDKKTIKVK